MTTPYHVRLAVSQYGEQFRAELFTEDLGDTEGDLLTELPPSIAEWVPYLAQGADLPPDAARQLGKDLFAALLGQPENAKKWAEVLTQAARHKQPIRLLIDATTEAVRDLPYGLLRAARRLVPLPEGRSNRSSSSASSAGARRAP